MGLGAAAAITAGVGLVGSVAGSYMQGQATKSAQSSANAAQAAAEERARADLAPYNTAGQTGLAASTDLLGLNGPDAATAAMNNFHTSPGYQFALDQGLRAVDAGAAAKGFARSGAALKAEQTFGTGLADQEFTNYYNRLFSLANLGENAAAKTGANAVTTGAGIAGTDVSSGAQDVSIYGNAAKGIGNTVDNYMNNRLYQDRYGLGGGSDPSWASLNRTNPTNAPNTWSSQPDSYYLPGGGGYQI
jgi:hypothetical protein